MEASLVKIRAALASLDRNATLNDLLDALTKITKAMPNDT